MHDPTPEQQAIIDESGHCLAIACPGSGKTFTLARKLRKVLDATPDHRGVVAISYTNKASDELESRCLEGGAPRRASFFGTIDGFLIREVLAFLPHVLELPPCRDLEVRKLAEIGQPSVGVFEKVDSSGLSVEQVAEVRRLFLSHTLALELVGPLANFVLKRSKACRRYICARYSHVAIDEYQDSGPDQHAVFLQLKGLGLISIAVGDLDQSIYGFAPGRDSKYLSELVQSKQFAVFPLSRNRRCHASISYYSLRLLNERVRMAPDDDLRVYDVCVSGSEAALGKWLTNAVPKVKAKFEVERESSIAVLVRGGRTAELISKTLGCPHNRVTPTPFDTDVSRWGQCFSDLLQYVLDRSSLAFTLAGKLLGAEVGLRSMKNCIKQLQQLRLLDPADLRESMFVDLVRSVAPESENEGAVRALREVLGDSMLLRSFAPPKPNEVQVMSLHRSKGLEFDVVFHLDLYDWILPSYETIKGDQRSLTQDLNLHYVGITRARKCVVLCSSSKRTKPKGEVVDAQASRFLVRNELAKFRKSLNRT